MSVQSVWRPAGSVVNGPVAQVYGVCFDAEGAILILSPDGATGWNLPGGHPEDDESPEQTLRRETLEEAATELGDLKLLGWFEVIESQRVPYCQCRYAAIIRTVRPPAPDPATGATFARRFVRPEEFLATVRIPAYGPMLEAAMTWYLDRPRP